MVGNRFVHSRPALSALEKTWYGQARQGTLKHSTSVLMPSGPVHWAQFHCATLDTIGNCQRPVFLLGVSQHMHKITNLWKFELNWSSDLRVDNYERKKHPCHTKLCAFRCLISGPQILSVRSPYQIHWKLLLSRKLRYFRGNRFSQCFILSISPHDSLQSKFLC